MSQSVSSTMEHKCLAMLKWWRNRAQTWRWLFRWYKVRPFMPINLSTDFGVASVPVSTRNGYSRIQICSRKTEFRWTWGWLVCSEKAELHLNCFERKFLTLFSSTSIVFIAPMPIELDMCLFDYAVLNLHKALWSTTQHAVAHSLTSKPSIARRLGLNNAHAYMLCTVILAAWH